MLPAVLATSEVCIVWVYSRMFNRCKFSYVLRETLQIIHVLKEMMQVILCVEANVAWSQFF
jgi:hypothetical protein